MTATIRTAPVMTLKILASVQAQTCKSDDHITWGHDGSSPPVESLGAPSSRLRCLEVSDSKRVRSLSSLSEFLEIFEDVEGLMFDQA